MYKINKNKRGFTLLEMVLVVAIIIILAAVIAINAMGIYRNAQAGAQSANANASSMVQGIRASDQALHDQHHF